MKTVSKSASNKAVALITVLLVISLLAIFVVTFLAMMGTERRSAQAFSDSQKSKMVAQGALAHAIEILRTEIPDPSPIHHSAETAQPKNWAINPGRLAIFDDQGNTEMVDLHTGAADIDPNSTIDPNVHSVDLNEPIPGKLAPTITYELDGRGEPDPSADPPQMRVKWVNTLSDPSKEADEENQIVSRHAFWIDDECGKINFNTAYGKPSPTAGVDTFHQQYAAGMMPAIFLQGRDDVSTSANTSQKREWALGKLRSVNLDVVFDSPNDIDRDGLLGNVFFRGFNRYPEAILDYVNLSDDAKAQWWVENRYHVGFYSRSPEFNAFGRPRFMTTDIPLSLEGGPLYQLPFVYNGLDAPITQQEIKGVLHLHSLLGSLGFTTTVTAPDGTRVTADNVVNRAQLEMLMRYFRRTFPGYLSSFVDKYGEVECAQIALNILNMARLATTNLGGDFSLNYSWRITSGLYSAHSGERSGQTPERLIWRFEPGTNGDPGRFLTRHDQSTPNTVMMIPQSPGPHITEVRLVLTPVPDPDDQTSVNLGIKLEGEYYMHGLGADVELFRFPMQVDFLELELTGNGETHSLVLDDPNWNGGGETGNAGLRIDPSSSIQSQDDSNPSDFRQIISGPQRFIGESTSATALSAADAKKFDIGSSYQIKVKFRGGLSIPQARSRAKQMFPIGEGDQSDSVLEADLSMDMSTTAASISWQIDDPRLSGNKDRWTVETSPSDDLAGTPAMINTGEPQEDSSEKSKFRYVQRGPGTIDKNGILHKLDRRDEFDAASRVSSKGFWSMIHTGMNSNEPFRTLKLASDNTGLLPDWVMMDLFGNTYPLQHDQWVINKTLPDEFSSISFMNSTSGAINLNSRTYPRSPYFSAPARKKPHEAVFKYLRSDQEVDQLVDAIDQYQHHDQFFNYVGELAEVNGYERSSSATEFENEELLRNMIGCLTTKSNTFGVWGVGQTVLKNRSNTKYGEFEDGDVVRSEKRFYAIVERYIWPGIDGVPGNAHVDSNGEWDRKATQAQDIDINNTDRLFQLPGSPPTKKVGTNRRLQLDKTGTYPIFDGPQEVELDQFSTAMLGNVAWEYSALEDAYNPPQPLIKYRVVYFKYLDE